MSAPDAVVVGSGPNGLAGALTLARTGLIVEVIEGAATPGGGCRTADLTLEGFHHDVCSSVHPLAACSPFFRSAAARGAIRFLTPSVAFAHPLGRDRAATVHGTVEQTAEDLGRDGSAYRRLISPLVRDVDRIMPAVLAPIRSVPDHPVAVLRFALQGLLPARRVVERFSTEETRALFAGASAHAMLPLTAPLSGAFGLLMTMAAHSVGWPVVEGGSARMVDAMLTELESLGGRVHTGRWIARLDDLPASRIVLLDITPRQLLDLAGPEPSRSVPPRSRTLRVRARGMQGGLGAQRSGSMERRRVPPGSDDPSRWHVRRDRQKRVGCRGGSSSCTPLLHRGPTVCGGPDTGSCRFPHAVGLLPRSKELGRRHDECDRIGDRAIRAGIPRSDLGTEDHHRSRHGSSQPQLRGRAHKRRCRHIAADDLPADSSLESLPDRHRRSLPLLRVHPTGRRCARHVRSVGSQIRIGGPASTSVRWTTRPLEVRWTTPPLELQHPTIRLWSCGNGSHRMRSARRGEQRSPRFELRL